MIGRRTFHCLWHTHTDGSCHSVYPSLVGLVRSSGQLRRRKAGPRPDLSCKSKDVQKAAGTRERLASSKLSNLDFRYDELLRWPLTIEDDSERLVAWVLEHHLRHLGGPYLLHKREATFYDYGPACATTYGLMLTLLCTDTSERLVNMRPAVESTTVSRHYSRSNG